jgi:hypothetical protein
MIDLDRDEKKQIVKDALKEWLEEKYGVFTKWALRTIAATVFGILARAYLSVHWPALMK